MLQATQPLSPLTPSPITSPLKLLKPQALRQWFQVGFSGIPSDLSNTNFRKRWIDPDAYNILFRLPKAELHLHQGGSADLSYLKYRLFRSIKEKEPHVQKIAIRDDSEEVGYRIVDFEGKSDHFILATLNFILLRDLLRFRGDEDQKVAYLDADLVSQLKGSLEQVKEIIKEYQNKHQSLLDEYRRVSDIINPYVKNTPSAYYLASLYANEAMEEHTRYAEYRISPLGRFDLTKHKKSFDGSKVEDVIKAVDEGFRDANLRVAKSGRKLEYGIIMLMERNPKSVTDLIIESIFSSSNTHPSDKFLELVKKAVIKIPLGKRQYNLDALRSMDPKDLKATIKKIETHLDKKVIKQIEEHNWQKAVDNAKQVAREAVRLKKMGNYNVVGIDLAGGESDSKVIRFKDAFDIIHQYNKKQSDPDKRLGITIHAGETEKSEGITGTQSIADAINVGWSENTPLRLGQSLKIVGNNTLLSSYYQDYLHNKQAILRLPPSERIRIIQSSKLLTDIVAKGIHLEYCPKSNVQTQGEHSHDEHPVLFLHRLGLGLKLNKKNEIVPDPEHPSKSIFSLGISTDNRTISNSDITNEWVKLLKHHGLTYEEAKQMTLNSFQAAFCDSKTKKALLEKVEDEFWDIEHSQKYYRGLYKLQHGLDAKEPTGAMQMNALAKSMAQIFLRESYRLGVNYNEAMITFFKQARSYREMPLKNTGVPDIKPKDKNKTIIQIGEELTQTTSKS